MDTKDVAKEIIRLAKAKGAEFAEVVVSQNEFSLKRIKDGQVDQPPAGEQWTIDVALVKAGRKQAATFDNPLFAKDIIQKMLKQMEFLPLQDVFVPSEVFPPVAQPAAIYDELTARLKGEILIETAKDITAKLEKHNLALAGKLAQSRGETTYQNSLGTKQTAKYTLACAALYAFDKNDSAISSYASSGGASIAFIEQDKERLLQELTQKCELQRAKKRIDLFANKKEGEDITIDVVFEPYFFAQLIDALAFTFNGLQVERGESFVSNKIGRRVTGENITMLDTYNDPNNRGVGLPFDFEGRPRQPISLIKQGVAKTALYDAELAKTWKKPATGNALPPSYRSQGAIPFNVVVKGGNAPLAEIIQNCKQPTLWITKLHYLGIKHYQTATMTGIAQHGVFLVENGKVRGPVENVRFEERIADALSRVEAMSEPRLVFDPLDLTFPFSTVVPAAKIKQFRFVGSTSRTV
ncbi:MAG TPA: TldD/PmbA family protein [Candidatus Paceibacterota bacterium]